MSGEIEIKSIGGKSIEFSAIDGGGACIEFETYDGHFDSLFITAAQAHAVGLYLIATAKKCVCITLPPELAGAMSSALVQAVNGTAPVIVVDTNEVVLKQAEQDDAVEILEEE